MNHTKAFLELKNNTQGALDFTLLTCHAIPALNAYMKAVDKGSAANLPKPHYFGEPETHERLKSIIPYYRKSLGKFLVLSSFSYFEAYVSDVLKEMFKFHDEQEGFLALSSQRRKKSFSGVDSDPRIEKSARKLRENPKKGKGEKYQKHNTKLKHTAYQFPSELLSTYGIIQLQSQLNKGFKAKEIPDLLKNALGLEISEIEEKDFVKIKDLRNRIAHGKIQRIDLTKAISVNQKLRDLAVRIDDHILKFFFVVEL